MLAFLFPAPARSPGELSEWPKEHDWKSCNGQKPFEGSNPSLSATLKPPQGGFFHARGERGIRSHRKAGR